LGFHNRDKRSDDFEDAQAKLLAGFADGIQGDVLGASFEDTAHNVGRAARPVFTLSVPKRDQREPRSLSLNHAKAQLSIHRLLRSQIV